MLAAHPGSPLQLVAHAVPEHTYGAQLVVAGVLQTPEEEHVEAALAVPEVQAAGAHPPQEAPIVPHIVALWLA